MTDDNQNQNHEGFVKRHWRPYIVVASIAIVFFIAVIIAVNYLLTSNNDKVSILIQIWKLIQQLFGVGG